MEVFFLYWFTGLLTLLPSIRSIVNEVRQVLEYMTVVYEVSIWGVDHKNN